MIIDLRSGLLSMPSGLGENCLDMALPIGPLMRAMAERWDAAGIDWAVLRNAEGLPDYTRYDLDVLVAPEALSDCLATLDAVVDETGWRIIGRIEKRYYTCLMLMLEGATPFFLPIDLFTALEYRGSHYANVQDVLQQRIKTDNGIWTIPSAVDAAITLLKELYPHKKLKANSRALVQAQTSNDPDGVRSVLQHAAGEVGANLLTQAVLAGAWDDLPVLSRHLRREPWWTFSRWPSVWANLRHLFRPSLGCVVALAGADGSGKSTLACGLAEGLYKQPFKGIYYVHGNIGVLPRFRDMRAWLVRKIMRKEPVVASGPEHLKGMMDPIPAWKSMILATYYALDLCLGKILLRRLRGQWMLVIMDRSFFDYYYQLGHRNCPRWYLDFLLWLIPKPDFLFCLTDDPGAIHQRKPELTVVEIGREQEIVARVLTRYAYACELDGRQGADRVIVQAAARVLDAVTQRGGA